MGKIISFENKNLKQIYIPNLKKKKMEHLGTLKLNQFSFQIEVKIYYWNILSYL